MQGKARLRKAGSGSHSENVRRGGGEGRQTDGGGRHRREGAKQFFSPLGASQHYSTNRSDREFYLSPRPICAVGLKFSLRKVFWIISVAILIQLLHHGVGANGGRSLSGVQSPSSSHLKWVHPEYTCCNRDIPKGLQTKLSKWQKLGSSMPPLPTLLFVFLWFFWLSGRETHKRGTDKRLGSGLKWKMFPVRGKNKVSLRGLTSGKRVLRWHVSEAVFAATWAQIERGGEVVVVVGGKQRRVVAAAARWLADLPVTPPPRGEVGWRWGRTGVGGAGTESGLPWQHLQCTGAIVYLPLRGLANGGILIGPSLTAPRPAGQIDSYPEPRSGEKVSRGWLDVATERDRQRAVGEGRCRVTPPLSA